jgi:hypothetical protein
MRIVYLFCFLMTQIAMSQDINLAMQNYKRGLFAQAEREFIQVLRTARANELKNRALKYLGISQYMQGKKESARKTFEVLKRSDSRASIEASEVLDDSVIAFFNAIRVQAGSTATAQRRTGIFIESNVPNANVSIGGILAGTVGRHIDARPGVQEVTVSASGFISKKARVNVTAGQSARFRIDLSKPIPKRAPAPPPAVARGRAPQPQRQAPPTQQQPTGVRDLFGDQQEVLPAPGRDLATEFQLESQRPAVAPMPPQPVMPQQPMYQPPPQMAYPMQPMMPMYQPQPMFQPAPMYQPPPPPMYPQYPTQPYMYEPPYPQQGIAAPSETFEPSQAAPPPSTFGPANERFLDDRPKRQRRVRKPRTEQRQPRVARVDRSSRSNVQTQKSSDSSGSVLAALMPLGIGQFYNGDYFLGTLFAASQIGAITYSIYNMNEANTQIKVMEEYFADPNATDAEKEAFEKDSKSYIQEKRSHQQYGLYGFVGLWAVSSIEAMVSAPSSSSASVSPNPYSHSLAQRSGFEFGIMQTQPKNYVPGLQFTLNW